MVYKNFLVYCIVLMLFSCKASPLYWITTMEEFQDPDAPYEAKQGWMDGCKSTLDKRKYPSGIRNFGKFFINPDLVDLPIYRDAWTNANYYCAMKFGHAVGKSYMGHYGGMLEIGTGGDKFAYEK